MKLTADAGPGATGARGARPAPVGAPSPWVAAFLPPPGTDATVDLMLTTACNLRCGYCYQRETHPRAMTEVHLRAALRWLVSSGSPRPRLTLFGGEPLLEPGLLRKAVTLLREEVPDGTSPDVHVVTNGLLLDEGLLAEMDRAGVHVDLSLDGVAAAQHVRGARTPERLDALLVSLSASHPALLAGRLTVKATLTSENASVLSDSLRYLLGRGAADVALVPLLTPDPGWTAAVREALDRELARAIEVCLEDHALTGRIAFQPFRPAGTFGGRSGCGPLCSAGRASAVFVDVDGTIAPCGAMAASVVPDPPPLLREAIDALGGLRVPDPDLDARLVARERRAATLPLLNDLARKRGRDGPCAGCETLGSCVVCPAAIANAPGLPDPYRVPDNQCDFNRLVARHRKSFLERLAGGRPRPAA